MQKVRYFIVPYVIVSAPAVAIYVTGVKAYHNWMDMNWFATLEPIQQTGYLYLTGAHLGPLWFVPMMTIIYLATPLFVYLSKHRNLFTVSLVLLAIAGGIVGRPLLNDDPIRAAIYYSAPYVLGMWLAGNQDVFKQRPQTWLAVLALLVVERLLRPLAYDVLNLGYVELFYFLDLALAVALMGVFYRFADGQSKWMSLFARISFFLFFVHGYFVGAIRMVLERSGLDVPFVIAFPLTLLVTLGGSLIAYIVLKLILGRHSRAVIGA